MDDAKYPIELIFKNMKFHITAFSTTCLISSDLGIPTAVFGADALNYYRRDIREEKLYWCNGSVASFIDFLKTPVQKNLKKRVMPTSKNNERKMSEKFRQNIANV